MNYKELLNKEQYEAVTTNSQHVRVIAGAGSGKTRVLTYRISYLINECHVEPWKILAITFTNKVANEMKQRVLKMNPTIPTDLKIQTFHAFCARVLREDIDSIGYSRNFTIIDDEDQEKIIKDLVAEDGYKRNDPIVRQTLNYISYQKNKGFFPEDITISFEKYPNEKDCLKYYSLYEETLRRTLCLDFDDLLFKTVVLLQENESIRNKWQRRIDHILVDEFQDTNDLQYKLIKLLKKPTATLFVVGDPDQTIYTWRGANEKIIMEISDDFKMETIILAQNYRSTKTILDTANKLISFNKYRVPKDLYTDNEEGSNIISYRGNSSEDEARWVIGQILKIKDTSVDEFKFSDVALLYRASYLTLPFEKELMKHRIPYRIYGGVRFYQRKEIKDVLAYFKLIVNKKDDISFLRIVNVPKRGIGEATLDILKKEALQNKSSLYEYIENIIPSNSSLKAKAIILLRELISNIDKVRDELNHNEEAYSSVLKKFITDIGYYDYLDDDEDDKADERVENVNALFDDVISFIKENPQSGFEEYLQNVSLLSAQDDMQDGDFVNLMTIHTAKGLEFPNVFLVGLMEGVFPSRRTVEESINGIEEERRLCYVAMTRAKKKLYVTYNVGYNYTIQSNTTASRFIKEAGLSLDNLKGFNVIKDEDGFPKASIYAPKKPAGVSAPKPVQTNNIEWKVNDIAEHDTFGRGIVKVVDKTLVTIDFENHGLKTLVGNHIKLHKINKGGFDA